MLRRHIGVTLLELLIAIVLFSIIVLGLSNIDIFSRLHVISSDRRAQLQNELSNALEHMGKRVIQGVGNQGQAANQPIQRFPPAGTITGFRVRVDPNQTLQNLTDDLWFNYVLNSNTNTLSCTCTRISAASPACPPNEILSTHIMPGVAFQTIMPSPLPNPPQGYYINLTDNNTTIEVGLVARFQPANNISPENPQIEMKFRMQTRLSAAR